MSLRLILAAFLLLAGFARGAAQEAIGTVSRIQGEASGTRGDTTRTLGLNASVFSNEVLSTGAAARLEVTFADNTQVTLAENARLTLDEYLFDPGTGRGGIRFRLTGALLFISGQVAKLASANVSVVTPAAAIGIRGTQFWTGPIDNQALGVFLIEGSVTVSNTAGAQTLNQPGQGTNIATVGAAPGPVTFWPQDKVNRALAAVSFR
jgi:hypothetical protein